MVEKVLRTIEKHALAEKGEGVIVGLSGGPDSVCLLHVLHSTAVRLSIRLFAVHINHMLRGEESEADECYVRELCRSLQIPLFVARQDVTGFAEMKGISIEEAGREIRYRQFELAAQKTGAGKIAVAHNRNDQAETVLMNIIRGTGLDGLKGMEYKTGKVIRPLLDIPRADIEAYCREHSLDPRTDSSNLQSIYTRNRVRLDLIPYVEKLFQCSLVESLSRMAFILKDDYKFLEDSARAAYEKSVIHADKMVLSLDLASINRVHPALRKRMIRGAVRQLKGDLKSLESVHVSAVEELCLHGRSGSLVCLPGGITVLKSYQILKFSYEGGRRCTPPFERAVKIPGETFVEEQGAVIETFFEKTGIDIEHYNNIRYNSFVQFFDYDKLIKGINIRNRRSGDVFKPYGSTGTKKLKEYLIDQKIPREERDGLPLIAMGSEIVWIIGHKISDKFKVTENTTNILCMKYKKQMGS